MRLPDYVTGLFIAGLGGLSFYGGSLLPPVPGQQVGPNVFPVVVGAGLMICGVMIALGIGRKFEDEAEADLAAIEGGAAALRKRARSTGCASCCRPACFFFMFWPSNGSASSRQRSRS